MKTYETAGVPTIVRLDEGHATHVLLVAPGAILAGAWSGATVCAAATGRRQQWREVDGAENPTCPRCRAWADREVTQ